MEETLFKLARAITDTGTDTVSSKGGTVTYRITSLKRKLVNGKVVSTSTPSCTLGSASVSWAICGGVTVGDGYLDVKINYSENTGSSRSTTLIFTQNGSNNTTGTTMKIPFYANDSEPGSRIECTTGDKVAVYTKSGATWISEGSFIVPSAGGTVSI